MVRGLILRLGRSGRVLAAAGGPVAARPGAGGVGFAAQPGAGDLLVQFGDQLVQLGRVVPRCLGLVAPGLSLGAVLDPHRLHLIRRGRDRDRLGVEVPAFGTLSGPQHLGSFGARRALAGEGGAAGDEDLLGLAGLKVDAAELDRVQAGAVGFGDRPHRVAGGRVGEPVGPGSACVSLAPSVLPASPVVAVLQLGHDGGDLLGGEAVQVQMLAAQQQAADRRGRPGAGRAVR